MNAEDLINKFNELHIKVTKTFAQSCADKIPKDQNFFLSAYQFFLCTDFDVSPVIESSVNIQKATKVLDGVHCFQINGIVNIEKPLIERYENSGKKRLLKLVLSDGTNKQYVAFEQTYCPLLSTETKLGTKILLKSVPVRHTAIALHPQCLAVLGGEVSELCQQRDRLIERIKRRDRPANSQQQQQQQNVQSNTTLTINTGSSRVLSQNSNSTPSVGSNTTRKPVTSVNNPSVQQFNVSKTGTQKRQRQNDFSLTSQLSGEQSKRIETHSLASADKSSNSLSQLLQTQQASGAASNKLSVNTRQSSQNLLNSFDSTNTHSLSPNHEPANKPENHPPKESMNHLQPSFKNPTDASATTFAHQKETQPLSFLAENTESNYSVLIRGKCVGVAAPLTASPKLSVAIFVSDGTATKRCIIAENEIERLAGISSSTYRDLEQQMAMNQEAKVQVEQIKERLSAALRQYEGLFELRGNVICSVRKLDNNDLKLLLDEFEHN